jgi:hypothetical protein
MLPTVGSLTSVLSLAIGAVLLSRLLNYAWLAGVAYFVVSVIQPSPIISIAVGLVLAALDSAKRRAWRRAGILIGLAILTEPSAVIPAALLLILALRETNGWHYLIPAALIPVGVLSAISLSLGGAPIISIVPGIVTLALPSAAGGILLSRQSLALLRTSPYVAILAIWSAILLVIALVGGTAPTLAVVPGLIAMIVGLRRSAPLTEPRRMSKVIIRWPRVFRSALLLVAIAIDFIVGIVLVRPTSIPSHSKAMGEWIATNTPQTAVVATYDIGALAYYANRPIIDLSGKIQPHPEALDADFFLQFAPDVLVLREGTEVSWSNFATTYSQANVYAAIGDQVVYRTVVNFARLDNHGVDVNYSIIAGRSDLRLTNVAIGNTLHPGDLVRIRLDWELAYAPSPAQAFEIKLNLVNEQTGQPVGGILDKLPPERWHAGKMSTYHAFLLPRDVPPDVSKLALYLGVTIRGAVNPDLRVAEVNVGR